MNKRKNIPFEFGLLGCLFTTVLATNVGGSIVHAQTVDGSLTNLFNTYMFHGTWEVFSKMNFIGAIMSNTISIFSLIGLFTVGMRLMLTLLYLSGRNFWDNVEEIKNAGNNQKFFGMGAIAKATYEAKFGTGLDAFVSFFLSLFPNIKAYSEYATNNTHGLKNRDENDTVTSYLLKSALPNIMIILAFTLGWNGTLWQAYGTVVKAMAAVGEAFVNERLDDIVTRALNSGSSYTFGFGADNSEYGAFKERYAKAIYNKLLSKTTDLSTDVKQRVGKKVESFVNTYCDYWVAEAIVTNAATQDLANPGTGKIEITGDKMKEWKQAVEGTSSNKTAREKYSKILQNLVNSNPGLADDLEFDVFVNSTKEYNVGSIKSFDGAGFDLASVKLWLHSSITKKTSSTKLNYFSVVEKESVGGSSSTSGTIQNVGG